MKYYNFPITNQSDWNRFKKRYKELGVTNLRDGIMKLISAFVNSDKK